MALFVLGPPDGLLKSIPLVPHLDTIAGSCARSIMDCYLESRQMFGFGRTSWNLHIHMRSLPEQTIAHAGGIHVILDRAAAPSGEIPGRSA